MKVSQDSKKFEDSSFYLDQYKNAEILGYGYLDENQRSLSWSCTASEKMRSNIDFILSQNFVFSFFKFVATKVELFCVLSPSCK